MGGRAHPGGTNSHPGGNCVRKSGRTTTRAKSPTHWSILRWIRRARGAPVRAKGKEERSGYDVEEMKGVSTSRRPPLAHLWHTSGTPLAHPWSTPGGSPRLPPEKNKKFLTEEQGHEEGGEEKGKKKAAHWSFGIGRLINECAAQSRAWTPERTTTYHSQGETPITHPVGKDHSH